MQKIKHLTFNEFAPDVELVSAMGQPVKLSSLWQGQVLVLAFTRHFGCPQCKEMLDRLVKFNPELLARGLSLVVVTQGTLEQVRAYCKERVPGILCLADPERKAYQAYFLGRTSWLASVFSPKVIKSNRRLAIEKGWNPELPPAGQDALQMSGLFIIGPDGRIRLPYYYDDISDHPSLELLIGGVMGMDWYTPLDSPIGPG